MGLIEQAQQDFADITANGNDFGIPITLISKKDGTTVTVNGLGNKIHDNIDAEGNAVHTKNSTAAISERILVAAGYPVRNANNDVDMNRDRISFADSSGVIGHYVIKSKLPDETIGSLVFVLSDYKNE